MYSKVEFNFGKPNVKESEKDTEKYLADEMIRVGGRSYKWSSPSQRAVPDRICVFSDTCILFVEVKSESKKLSPLQKILHQQLEVLVDKVYVVSTKAEVDTFIEDNRVILF